MVLILDTALLLFAAVYLWRQVRALPLSDSSLSVTPSFFPFSLVRFESMKAIIT